ncbi:hypothetical protein BDN72DRAFT_6614 [Pluteus cervinus]|uniref:Uncharacterized protein n=1 Tax=Pluteus cervinus TaxID=181527 RepID=A0ACD3BEW5_9AGAR|nr:hypothetical protein BDN72DRAFT_6614 [Pluteus cervinus]
MIRFTSAIIDVGRIDGVSGNWERILHRENTMVSYEEIQMLTGIQACNYSAMGALAWTVHEMAIMIQREYEEMWLKPWSNLKLLFYFLRIVNLGSQIVSMVMSLRFAAGYKPTDRGCRMLIGFQGTTSAALVFATQFILLLRVEALYYERTSLRYILRFLFLSEVILMTVILGLSIPRIGYGIQCVALSFPYMVAVFFFTPIIFESVLFILTMVKFYEAARDGWGRESVLSRFLQDGLWAFALPFSVLIVNAGCTMFLPGPKSSIAYPWMIAVPGFAGCRLILNLSHLLKTTPPQHGLTSRATGLIDTVIETYQGSTGGERFLLILWLLC